MGGKVDKRRSIMRTAAVVVAGLVAVLAPPGAAGAPARPPAAASYVRLEAVRDVLRETAGTPGTSWAVDRRAGKVVVTADRTVTRARYGEIVTAARAFGDKVEVRRTEGRFRPYARGGEAVGRGCSLGFNVVAGDGTPYFLTSGHCVGAVGTTVYDGGGRAIGVVAGSTFPGGDYAIVKYNPGIEHPSEIDLYDGTAQTVSRAAEARVGEAVRSSGSGSGVHGGTVTAVNVAVQYPEGTVTGLIEAALCAGPGDSGGPLFEGDTALGLTVGGSGDCTTGGTAFFQPVTDPLAAYGVSIG
ncbi:S1 family peptidase [Streptomyces luteireticuli]|uniref:S1 family peptidase n=1 Tax=Streptomyces luteireticuli TaxID=173858 RepID=UPI0031DF908B